MPERRVLTDDEHETLRRRWEKQMNIHIRERRIRAVEINSVYKWQPKLHVEVGHYCANLWKDSPPELILAIFESTTFFICTPDHGVDRGVPHVFTSDDVRRVIPWD